MMLINHTLRKPSGGYKFIKSKEKKNNSMYVADSNIFTINKKEFETQIYRLENNVQFLYKLF